MYYVMQSAHLIFLNSFSPAVIENEYVWRLCLIILRQILEILLQVFKHEASPLAKFLEALILFL